MQMMRRRRIFPTFYAQSISEVTPEFIHACGCSAVLADIDNTLSHVDAPDAVPEAVKWMLRMQQAGVALALISNNDPPRVEPFAEKYSVAFICHAQKPKPNGFHVIARQLGRKSCDCLVVGDQLFTDILGGNAAGMRTVIVPPLCEAEDPKPFRKRRRLERVLLKIDTAFCKKQRRIGAY